MAEERTFTGETLVEALKSGDFDRSGIVLVGMVKASEQDDHVAFARGGCDSWVEIPADMIERAEQVGSRACEDHSHPVFRITLRDSDNPQAKVLGQLITASPQLAPLPHGFGQPGALPHRLLARQRGGLFGRWCYESCAALLNDCARRAGGDVIADVCWEEYAVCTALCDLGGLIFTQG